MNLIKWLSACLLSLVLLSGGAPRAGATTYSNSHASIEDVSPFGFPNTTTYGQTFVAPGGSLLSWTFFYSTANSAGARFVVAGWNGTGVQGGVELFSTTAQTVADFEATESWSHTFSGINLTLTAGSTYIAYLTVAGVASPVSEVIFNGSDASPLGGVFVFNNSGGVDPLLNNFGWEQFPDPQFPVQYVAEFSTAAVPETSTWAMMLLGFAGLGFAAYRKTGRCAKVDA